MRNLLKALHYVSTNLAKIRLDLPYAMTKYPDDTWKNVENMLAGANHTIETAMAEMYAIEEMAELKNDIKTPPFTDAQERVIQATKKLGKICDVDEDI